MASSSPVHTATTSAPTRTRGLLACSLRTSRRKSTPLTIAAPGLLDNDADADGDALTASLVAQPSHGSVIVNGNGSFTYTPTANYFGGDSFTYRVYDGEAYSNTAPVTLRITGFNDAPVANPDGALPSQVAKLLAADGAVSDTLGYSIAISGDTMVVGAFSASVGSKPEQGAAYIFVNSSGNWVQQAKLVADDGAAGDCFGHVSRGRRGQRRRGNGLLRCLRCDRRRRGVRLHSLRYHLDPAAEARSR